MLFKDLKQGQQVYVLDRKLAEYYTGTVEDTPSLPHYDPRQPIMMVDIRMNIKGESRVYSIPENQSLTYTGELCISVEQRDLIPIVKEIELKADEALADYARQKKVKERCKSLILELNPELKEKRQND